MFASLSFDHYDIITICGSSVEVLVTLPPYFVSVMLFIFVFHSTCIYFLWLQLSKSLRLAVHQLSGIYFIYIIYVASREYSHFRESLTRKRRGRGEKRRRRMDRTGEERERKGRIERERRGGEEDFFGCISDPDTFSSHSGPAQ